MNDVSLKDKSNKTNFEKIIRHIFEVLSLVPFIYVFITGFRWITMFPGESFEDNRIIVDQSPIKGFIFLIAFLIIMFVYCLLLSKIFKKINMDILAIGLTVVVILMSVHWIITTVSYSWAADPSVCYGMAYNYNNGDYSGCGPGSYIASWPHQLGLISIWRVCLWLFGTEYEVLRYIYIPIMGIMFYSGYKITSYISNEERCAIYIYFLLFLTSIPIFGYTTVPYNDMPSIALVLFSAWMYIECIKRMSWWKIVLALFSLTLSYLFRTNSIIFFIGILIVIGVIWARNKKNIGILLIVLLVAALIGKYSMPIVYHNKISYEWKIPYSSWVAMGLDYETDGWWDAYSIETMKANNFDTQTVNKLSNDRIKEEISYLLDNPGKLITFANNKIQIQWNAPDLQCFNNGPFDFKYNNIMTFLYNKVGPLNVIRYMDVCQLFIYLGIVIYLITGLKDSKRDFLKYILLVGIFGGFIFTLIWEAKTRYVYGYYVALIPYASAGVGVIITIATKKLHSFFKLLKERKINKEKKQNNATVTG